ncbi:MAG: O-antigen ligase family protein [Burkholderiaceae bacterium]
MLQAATYSLSALGVFAATLACCAALFVSWQKNWIRDNLIAIFISVLMVLGLIIAVGSNNVDQAEGGSLRQAATGIVYLLSLWYASRLSDGTWISPIKRVPLSLIALLGFAFLSAFWSAAPDVTIRRAVQFSGLVLFAAAVVQINDSNGLWRRYLNPTLLWLALGLIVAPFATEFAYDANGNFRGLSSHKNSWAGIALVATILSALEIKRQPKSPYLWCALGVSLLTILLTRSATALSLAAAVVAFGALYALSQSRDQLLKGALLVGALLLWTIPFAYLFLTGESPLEAASELYFGAVQKEATLTGRNVLWSTILEHAWLNPVFGNGYGAFWIGDTGPSVAVVASLNWLPVHSHNGYIDLFNELGGVGVILFALLVIQHFHNILRVWRLGAHDSAILHLAISLAVLGYNFSETSLLAATHFLWILLIVSVVDVYRLACQEATGAAK